MLGDMKATKIHVNYTGKTTVTILYPFCVYDFAPFRVIYSLIQNEESPVIDMRLSKPRITVTEFQDVLIFTMNEWDEFSTRWSSVVQDIDEKFHDTIAIWSKFAAFIAEKKDTRDLVDNKNNSPMAIVS